MSRVLLLEGGTALDIFELVELTDAVARVRSAYLFEVGEELSLRIENERGTADVVARVRAHLGTSTDKLTELELATPTTTGPA